jgi:hypothetical protein
VRFPRAALGLQFALAFDEVDYLFLINHADALDGWECEGLEIEILYSHISSGCLIRNVDFQIIVHAHQRATLHHDRAQFARCSNFATYKAGVTNEPDEALSS